MPSFAESAQDAARRIRKGLSAFASQVTQGERLARPPVERRGYGVPTREPTPELVPKVVRGSGGLAGEYDRMERGHPRIASGARKLALAIASRPPMLAGAADETPAEARFRETLDAMLVQAPVVDAKNSGTGWGTLSHSLAYYWTRGCAIYEPRFVAKRGCVYDDARANGFALEMFPIHLSSVQDWITEPGDDSRLLGIRQHSSNGAPIEVLRPNLVHLQYGGAVGEWEGISILRPLVFVFERWAGMLRAAERNAHLQGGFAKLGRPAAVDAHEELTMIQWLDSIGIPYVAMPQGYAPTDLVIEYPTGSMGGVNELRYIDSQIDLAFGEALQSLSGAANGSRALGEEINEDAEWLRTAQLSALYDALVAQVGAWLAKKLGFSGRLPSVELDADVSAVAEAKDEAAADDVEVEAARVALAEHDACCGCSTEFAEARITVRGADGLPYQSPSELSGVEVSVAWATLDADRERTDAAMRREIDRLAHTQRNDVWDALVDGWQPGERDRVRGAAVASYVAALQSYRQATALIIGRHAADELARQVAGGLPVADVESSIAADAMRAPSSRIDQQIQIAAETIANRVQGEVEGAWTSGIPRGAFVSAITVAGLTGAAVAVGNTVESRGRVEAARDVAEAGPAGLRIVRVIRSSVRDKNRCKRCKDRSGEIYQFPRDEAAFDDPDNQLPDPECHGNRTRGANRCRCGWLIEWGRA